MEFDETPRYLYLRVARDVWINFSSRTVEFRPSKSRENPHFLSISFFLSLSIIFYSLSFLVCFSFPPPVSLPFLPYPTEFPLFSCLFLSYFSISFSFPLFFSFYLIFLFLFFFLVLLSFYLILIHPLNLSKSGENFPLLSSMPHVITMFFFLIFFIFIFPFITSCNPWLNVRHLFQVHHMDFSMCNSLGVPYGIHMIMPCVTRHPVSRKK